MKTIPIQFSNVDAIRIEAALRKRYGSKSKSKKALANLCRAAIFREVADEILKDANAAIDAATAEGQVPE